MFTIKILKKLLLAGFCAAAFLTTAGLFSSQWSIGVHVGHDYNHHFSSCPRRRHVGLHAHCFSSPWVYGRRCFYHERLFVPTYVEQEPIIVVQSPPSIIVRPSVTVVTHPPMPQASNISNNDFTVNVPNDTGGYIAVVIRRVGNGYLGPQGEFYPEFPKIAQLKAMYAS